MPAYRLLLIACSLAFTAGCAESRCAVGVTTYLSHELTFPIPHGDQRIAVIAEIKPEEPLLQDELRRKVEHLLEQQGFTIGTPDDSEYILIASFRVDAGRRATGIRPIYEPGSTTTSRLYTDRGRWATMSTDRPGHTNYVPYDYVVFPHTLGLDLFEQPRWLATGPENRSKALVWRSESGSEVATADLRAVVDYLLVASFEHFGQDTGRRLDEDLGPTDTRVVALRESAQPPAPHNPEVRQARR